MSSLGPETFGRPVAIEQFSRQNVQVVSRVKVQVLRKKAPVEFSHTFDDFCDWAWLLLDYHCFWAVPISHFPMTPGFYMFDGVLGVVRPNRIAHVISCESTVFLLSPPLV